jgi:hypothetical protein
LLLLGLYLQTGNGIWILMSAKGWCNFFLEKRIRFQPGFYSQRNFFGTAECFV